MASWRVLDIEHLKPVSWIDWVVTWKLWSQDPSNLFLELQLLALSEKRTLPCHSGFGQCSKWTHLGSRAGQQQFKGCWAGTFHHPFLLSLLMQALEPHHPNRGANMPTRLVEPLATFHVSSMWANECPLRFDDLPSRLGECFKIDDLQSSLRFIIKLGHRVTDSKMNNDCIIFIYAVQT